jgi:hypothetical protein
MWAKEDANLLWGADWQQALDYVKTMNSGSGLCGHNDWRLPNINELSSLENKGVSSVSTWLIAQGFANVQASPNYWSSTTFALSTVEAWLISMVDGAVGGTPKSSGLYAWPVRGSHPGSLDNSVVLLSETGQTKCHDVTGTEISCGGTGEDGDIQAGVAWPDPRFTVGSGAESECITDHLTGLMWAKDANLPNGAQTWQEALNYVKGMNSDSGLCGHNDWRLPNIKELSSLTNKGASPVSTWLTAQGFIDVWSDYYWSSTTYAYNPSSAWGVNTWNDVVYSDHKGNGHLVWPVREGSVGESVDLTVTKTGSGNGTVTSSPMGVACGSSCTGSYAAGTNVTLTAIPDSSSVFIGWSGSCTGTGPCAVTLSADTAVTANFVPATTLCDGMFDDSTWTLANSPYRVTCDVALFPGKVLTVEPGVSIYVDAGKTIIIRGTLNAIGTVDNPIVFTSTTAPEKWAGIQLATNQGGTGTFDYAEISYAENGVSVECCWGADEPANISHSTFKNNTIALSGYAGNNIIVTDSTFEDNYCAVDSADKKIYYSDFRNNTYGLCATERISVYASTFAGNETALNGGRGELKHCDISNNETGVDAFFEGFTMKRNTISNNGIGIILGSYDGFTPPMEYNNIFGNAPYNVKNTGVSDKNVPNNWWGTTDENIISAGIFDAYDDVQLGIVHFTPILTLPVDITPVPEIAAAPNSYEFGSLLVDGSISASWPITISNIDIVQLEISTVTITGVNAEDFVIGADDCSAGTFAESESCDVNITFSPKASGPRAAELSIASNDPNKPVLEVPLTGTGISVLHVFIFPGYTAGSVAGVGISCPNDCEEAYSTVTEPLVLTATANPGYHFVNWTGDVSSSENPVTIDTSINSTITAKFALNTYTITTSVPGGHGTLTCNSPVNHGTNSTCTITPDAGYHLATLTDNGTSAIGAVSGNAYTITSVTADHTVEATFEINTYAITTSVPGGHGTLTCDSPVNHGANSTCTITPEAGYHLATLTDNGTSVIGSVSGNAYTITNVTADHTISATFAIDTFTITLTVTGGPQNSSYNWTVNYGEGLIWEVAEFMSLYVPEGYQLVGLADNGDSMDSEAGFYVIDNISADHLIEVTVAITTYTISGTVTSNGAGLSGVTMNGLPGNPATDGSGAYSATVNYGWSGTVTPSKYGNSFTPASRVYTSVATGKTDQNYTSGRIPTISLGTGTGRRGDNVSVPVILSNVEGTDMSAISVDINYDTSVLENPSALTGPAGTAAGKTITTNTPSPGLLRVIIISTSNSIIGDGVVAYVSFGIKTGSVLGDTVLTEIPTASNPGGQSVTVDGTDGSVTVTDYAAGDCNTDSTVSISEVQSAINMFLGINPVEGCVDTNGSTEVSIGELQRVINNHLGISILSAAGAAGSETSKSVSPLLAISASIAGLPSVDLAVTSGSPGETVALPLQLKNAAGYTVTAISSDIVYDAGKLENPTVNLGAAGSSAGKTVISNIITPGVLRVGIISLTGNTAIGDGVVATINFTIKTGAAEGGSTVQNNPTCADSLGNDFVAKKLDGIININVQGFGDVPEGYWAMDFVNAMSNFGITSGCGNGNFCPDEQVTRAQMAVFLLKALGETPALTCGHLFSDVDETTNGNAVFCRYIEKFSTLGITAGCGTGNFCPNDPVSRMQMAVFITKALGETMAATCGGTFNDVDETTGGNSAFCKYIEKFATLGITSGCGNGNFCPDSPVTRAQMAVFLTKGFLQ